MENSVHSVLNCMAADFAEPLGYLIAGFFPALILTGAAALVSPEHCEWVILGAPVIRPLLHWRRPLSP